MSDLTIRNLTKNQIELIQVQRFEGEKVATGNAISNITGAISGFLNATEHSTHELVARGDSREKKDVSFKVDPFKATKTNVRSTDASGSEVLRLTFKTENHKYETDVPSPTKKSAVMKKLDRGPHDLTVVYVPSGSVLAVFSSAKLNAWMHELHDDWPLTVLSIPGTHNSPTCYTALPSVRCQSVGVPEQLANGVRFMDIRVSAEPGSDDLALVHSAFPISLTGTKYLRDMLDDVYSFLEKNKSETVIMSLKREGTGKGTDADLCKALKTAYAGKKKERWWTDSNVPTLGQARGKIVLMRRFATDDKKGYGIDAQHWPDNCEDGKVGKGHIRVQDFYEITESQNIEKKIDYSRGQLERAAEQNFFLTGGAAAKGDDKKDDAKTAAPPFFVNFLSASNFFNASCWPERIAAKVNPAVVEYLCVRHGEDGKGPRKLKVGTAGTGIVVTDWVGANDDWDLVRCIVGMNARLQLKN
ncbi:phosphatidylinositol-specific phospholipase c, X domain-containing protein [Sarocladium implicatum]|nr:phosphatidylinositol-specific phospholipase c, X domain-containing protein [Sarocladium implicatum]